MLKNLYILGNGFDLHHGLGTSYKDFCKFLQNEDIDLFNVLDKFIDFRKEEGMWADFENDLSKISLDKVLSSKAEYLPDLLSPDFRDRDLDAFPFEIEELVEIITNGIMENFSKFIKTIKYQESTFEKALKIEKQSFFLNFNFTITLESIYNLKSERICYIHNSAFSSFNKIILGHNIQPDSFISEPLSAPYYLRSKEKEIWEYENYSDYSLRNGKRKFMKYFQDTFKPTALIISKNTRFFRNLGSVKNIFVLGHSLSDVDLPYFNEILKNVNANTKWFVSFYKEEDLIKHKRQLISIGVNVESIQFIKLEELLKTNNQLKLPVLSS